jgi:hypothetical protein
MRRRDRFSISSIRLADLGSPLSRYSRSKLLRCLVWGIFCQEVWVGRRIFSFVSFFARSEGPFLRLVRSRDDDQRGARLQGAEQSRHNLVFGGSKDPNHDAVIRIGSEAPRRRTHSLLRRDKPCSVSGHRRLEPSSATVTSWTDCDSLERRWCHYPRRSPHSISVTTCVS